MYLEQQKSVITDTYNGNSDLSVVDWIWGRISVLVIYFPVESQKGCLQELWYMSILEIHPVDIYTM